MRLAALALVMLGAACSPDHSIRFEITSEELDYALEEVDFNADDRGYQEILIPVSSCQDGDFEKFRSETLSSGLDAQLCGQTLEEIVMSFSEE